MSISWDTTTLPFQSVMFARRNLSRSGGRTVTGVEQVVQSATDFWEAQATIRIRTYEQKRLYRAYQAQNWGRTGEWIIPTCDPFPPPPGGFATLDYSFSSDFSTDFSLGSSAPPFIPEIVDIDAPGFVTTITSRGSRTLVVQMLDIHLVPLPGQYFTIDDRLYLIGTVTGSGGTYTLTFAPSLRTDALVDVVVDFSRPRCLMRLAEDNVGQMNLDLLRFADIQLNFVEVPV